MALWLSKNNIFANSMPAYCTANMQLRCWSRVVTCRRYLQWTLEWSQPQRWIRKTETDEVSSVLMVYCIIFVPILLGMFWGYDLGRQTVCPFCIMWLFNRRWEHWKTCGDHVVSWCPGATSPQHSLPLLWSACWRRCPLRNRMLRRWGSVVQTSCMFLSWTWYGVW